MKRLIDMVLATTVFVLLLPVMLMVAFLVLVVLGRPILFRQTRPGQNAVPFELVKFRTMSETGGADEVRLGRFGQFLRKTSLDELPELLSIIKGEMSFVGPRPLLMEYLPLYTKEQSRRHDVRPGLTGWAQVNGRNLISWSEKFELDVWYVDNHSILLDFRIMVMTFWQVLQGVGTSHPGEVTMTKFGGDES
jgi:sugar transferase EpsL